MEPSLRPSRTFPTPESDPPRVLGRREFLIVAGGTVAYAALGPVDAWARRVRAAAVTLQPWSLPAEAPAGGLDLARALVGAAVLAPSDWNTQPWRFEVDPGSIRLLADVQRALPTSDPDRRGLMVSLGAALENLVVAARAYGLQPTVRYRPDEGARGAVAEMTWLDGGPRRDRELFGALTERRTNRRNYDGRGLMPQIRAQLSAQVADGPRLYWLDGRDALRELADLVHDAVRVSVSNRLFQAERHGWLRSSLQDAELRGDGMPEDALCMSGPANWFAGHYYDPKSWFLRLGAGSLANRAREGVRSAGAVVLLTTTARDESACLLGGQAYERLALKATQLGLAHQPINAPLELDRFRAPLLRQFGVTGEEPLMLVRCGHDGPVPHTPRRAVSVVATFRNS